MTVEQKKRFVYLGAMLLAFFLVGYNYWSFVCGQCTAASLRSFSPPAVLLLAGAVVAGIILLFLRARNRRLARQRQCACGAHLRGQWFFCPKCGQQRKP